jgi:NitT/TauT family transport system permease protein
VSAPALDRPTSGRRVATWLRRRIGLIIVFVSLFLLWEFAVKLFGIKEYLLPPPSRIWTEFLKRWPIVFSAAWVTTQEILGGYLLAVVVSIPLAWAVVRWRFVEEAIYPVIVFLQIIPKIAIAPLFIIWFGIGITSKVVLVFLIVYFLVFFNTYGGVRAASLDLRNVMRLLGANDREIALKVVLPATLPWIFVGLKVAVPNAMIGVVVGEFMAASHGLGFLIQLNTSYFHTTAAMALILLIMAIVVAWTQVISQIERYLLRWRPRDLSRQGVEL